MFAWLVFKHRHQESLPFSDSVIDAAAVAHILDGDEEYKGGHRHDSRIVGKTVFPERWTDTQIVLAVKATVRRPDYIMWLKPRVVLRSLILGVIVEVSLTQSKNRWKFRHAFPNSGAGVYRNESLRRVELPLDLTQLEA